MCCIVLGFCCNGAAAHCWVPIVMEKDLDSMTCFHEILVQDFFLLKEAQTTRICCETQLLLVCGVLLFGSRDWMVQNEDWRTTLIWFQVPAPEVSSQLWSPLLPLKTAHVPASLPKMSPISIRNMLPRSSHPPSNFFLSAADSITSSENSIISKHHWVPISTLWF